jgi:hypothetical protein
MYVLRCENVWNLLSMPYLGSGNATLLCNSRTDPYIIIYKEILFYIDAEAL